VGLWTGLCVRKVMLPCLYQSRSPGDLLACAARTRSSARSAVSRFRIAVDFQPATLMMSCSLHPALQHHVTGGASESVRSQTRYPACSPRRRIITRRPERIIMPVLRPDDPSAGTPRRPAGAWPGS